MPVKNALEVDQIFDHISYLKGSSVIRMLSTHLGRETFLRGVAQYLKSHAYRKLQPSAPFEYDPITATKGYVQAMLLLMTFGLR